MATGAIIAIIVVVIIVIIGIGLVVVFVVMPSGSSQPAGEYVPPLGDVGSQSPTGGPPYNQGSQTPIGGGGGRTPDRTTPTVTPNPDNIVIMDNINSRHQWGWTRAEAQRIASHFGGRMASKQDIEKIGHQAGKNVMTPDFIGVYLGNGQWDPNNKGMRNWEGARNSWYFVGRPLSKEDHEYAWKNSAPL